MSAASISHTCIKQGVLTGLQSLSCGLDASEGCWAQCYTSCRKVMGSRCCWLTADESADAHQQQLPMSNTASQEAFVCLWLSFLAVSVLLSPKVSSSIKVIKVRLQDRNQNSFRWRAHWSCVHLHAPYQRAVWAVPWQPSAHLFIRTQLRVHITLHSEAASCSACGVKLGVGALPCSSASITALQLRGAGPPRTCPHWTHCARAYRLANTRLVKAERPVTYCKASCLLFFSL